MVFDIQQHRNSSMIILDYRYHTCSKNIKIVVNINNYTCITRRTHLPSYIKIL